MTAIPIPRRGSLDAAAWGRACRGEATKLLGLRSTWLILIGANLFGILVGVLTLRSTASSWATMSPADRAAFDATADAFSGFQFAQLALGTWGVLAATSEYSASTITSTLTAVPRRLVAFAAKFAVVTAVSVPLSLASTLASWTIGQQMLHSRGIDAQLGDPGVGRAIISAAAMLVVVTVVGLGIGAVLRHSAAAVAFLVGLLFLAWPAARAFEGISYLPDRSLLVNAADALVTTHPTVGPNALRTPTPGAAVIVIATYVVVFVCLGAARWRTDP
jgi:ABC-2 type transport system permease protein